MLFRSLKRGEDRPTLVTPSKVDTFVDELEEWAAAVRGHGAPEVDGEQAVVSLAVMRAGIAGSASAVSATTTTGSWCCPRAPPHQAAAG